MNYSWLRSLPKVQQEGCVVHVHVDAPVDIVLDSVSSCGSILRSDQFDSTVGQVNSFLEMEGLMWQ